MDDRGTRASDEDLWVDLSRRSCCSFLECHLELDQVGKGTLEEHLQGKLK